MKKAKKIYQAPVSRVITMDTSQSMLVIASNDTPKETVRTTNWTQETDGTIETDE